MSHVTTQLTAYLDCALQPAERGAVEAHLATCPDCRSARDRIALVLLALRRLPPAPELSPGFEQRFQARLARERSRRRGPWARLSWRVLVPVAAAGAVAAVAVLVARPPEPDAGQVLLAEHLELLESFDVVALAGDVDPGDFELVAHLHELGDQP